MRKNTKVFGMHLSRRQLGWGGGLILWMGIIFLFSEQPGSGTDWQPPLWYILERKSAHVVEYAILLLLAAGFFHSLFLHETWRRILLTALCFSWMYGALDEIHQFFIFGRGSKFSDVLIDVAGALLMTGALMLWRTYRK